MTAFFYSRMIKLKVPRKRYKIQNLTQGKINDLSSSITMKEIESLFKTIPTKETP